MKLERWILLGFGLGVAIGFLSRVGGLEPLRDALIAMEPIGTAFIRLVSMVVVPLVVASVFVGVASLGNVRALGRIGGKTLLYFVGTTFAAALIGLAVATLAGVGGSVSDVDRDALLARAGATATAPLPATTSITVGQTLMSMIPQNPVAAAAQGDLLPLIVAVVIFAAAATVTSGDGHRAVLRFFQGINEISMVVIGWLMRLAPIAVFALIAATVARSGISLLTQLLAFSLVAIAALAIHVAITLVPALRFGARMKVSHFVRSVSDALLLAFSTASSNATLPVSMAAARNRLGLPADVVAFVLPPGASLNKNGSAAYKAVAAVFIAHLYGMSLTAPLLLTILLMATVAAFAGAGVPGSSLITTLIVLNSIGLGPRAAAGIALVTAVDRPLDMCRSCVNTFSNLVGTAWIARAERGNRQSEQSHRHPERSEGSALAAT
jgi:DAACS family dicarboxylate/amino acid:cation (Na+ or H+) symporter